MNKSFTLVEILVSLFIFSIVIGITSGFFVSALKAQRHSLASQELLDQTSYLVEYLNRAIRMAKKDVNGDCITAKLNYEITPSGQGIKFKNYQDICQEFYLDNNQLKQDKAGVLSELTSDNLEVISFNIGPSNSWDQDDDEQSRVTLFLDIRGAGQKPEEKPEIKIQTTISQRNLDVRR